MIVEEIVLAVTKEVNTKIFVENLMYNWECKKTECDAGYDGQSSKNNFTRSGQHRSLYNSWVRHEDGSINPKSGKGC